MCGHMDRRNLEMNQCVKQLLQAQEEGNRETLLSKKKKPANRHIMFTGLVTMVTD